MAAVDLSPLALVGVAVAAPIVMAVGLAVGAPAMIFRRALRRHRASWNVVREVAVPSGAYRSSSVAVVRRGVPITVSFTSAFGLYLVALGVLGLLVDAANGAALGPAVDFQAVVLGAVVAVTSVRLVRRAASIASVARVVAAWELVFAVTLAPRVLGASLLFAAVIVLHALALLAAAGVQRRATVGACT